MTTQSIGGTKDNPQLQWINELIQRSLLVALMKKHHFNYQEAVNGLEALNIYKASASSPFDVVLMGKIRPSFVHEIYADHRPL